MFWAVGIAAEIKVVGVEGFIQLTPNMILKRDVKLLTHQFFVYKLLDRNFVQGLGLQFLHYNRSAYIPFWVGGKAFSSTGENEGEGGGVPAGGGKSISDVYGKSAISSEFKLR